MTPAPEPGHPRLRALIGRACAAAAAQPALPRIGIVWPCDASAMRAAADIAAAGLAQPVLIGPLLRIRGAAKAAGLDAGQFEIATSQDDEAQAARTAANLARDGYVGALMKGSLHTDALMGAVVARESGLRGARRIGHAFVFDLPRYPKLLALADCVVNIAPDLPTKHDIVFHAAALLRTLGIAQPKVGVLAAVETVNAAIPATLDARALVRSSAEGRFGPLLLEGPFGFDNAWSAEAARTKGLNSQVAGDADLMIVPDLNAGNILYKSFVYAAGGDCAGLVLGAKVPVVLTSRADSALARLASAALAVLATAGN